MECLEELNLSVSEVVLLIGVDEYKKIQSKTRKERLGLALDKESGRFKPLDAVKPWMWPLPKLKSLDMDGPPAMMFSLDWLLVCPKLTSFDLGKRVDSQVGRLEEDWNGYSFVKAIMDADNINSDYAIYERKRRTESGDYVAQVGETQESNLRLPGKNLTHVYSGYSYGKNDLRKLNLVKIKPNQEEEYEDRNMRVYSILTQVFVHLDDFDTVEYEGGSDQEDDDY
ncbi:hypothetical protein BGX26_012377 [Mortierella sp. AD094]|nr:hypothetical protein BGX26_012377 [Mortierella sp. AD094]